MKLVCRFTFEKRVDAELVEGQLALAILVAECMFGRAGVRLDTRYTMSDDGQQLVLDVCTDIGQWIAQVFTGLLIRELGEEAFRVEGVGRPAEAA